MSNLNTKRTLESANVETDEDNIKSNLNDVKIDEDYVPSEQEEYMNEKQLKYFQRKLLAARIGYDQQKLGRQ